MPIPAAKLALHEKNYISGFFNTTEVTEFHKQFKNYKQLLNGNLVTSSWHLA